MCPLMPEGDKMSIAVWYFRAERRARGVQWKRHGLQGALRSSPTLDARTAPRAAAEQLPAVSNISSKL